MRHEVSRRELLKSAALAGALAPTLGLIGKQSQASDLTPLDENDLAAKAFAFVNDASKVEASANPAFKAGQLCAECSLYQGKPTDATAGCSIFPGRSVPARGWCKVWVRRSG